MDFICNIPVKVARKNCTIGNTTACLFERIALKKIDGKLENSKFYSMKHSFLIYVYAV